MATYQYRNLASTDRPIRILELAPAVDQNAPIECRLVELGDRRDCSYEAVSYVWGSSTGNRPNRLRREGNSHHGERGERSSRATLSETMSKSLG
jgi:hypothetical protein